jgi:hypothetical protein
VTTASPASPVVTAPLAPPAVRVSIPPVLVCAVVILLLWMGVLTAWLIVVGSSPSPSPSQPQPPASKPDPVAEAAAAYLRAIPDGYGAAAVAASKGASSAEAYQALTDTLKLPEEALAGALAKETDFAGALARARAAMKAALR